MCLIEGSQSMWIKILLNVEQGWYRLFSPQGRSTQKTINPWRQVSSRATKTFLSFEMWLLARQIIDGFLHHGSGEWSDLGSWMLCLWLPGWSINLLSSSRQAKFPQCEGRKWGWGSRTGSLKLIWLHLILYKSEERDRKKILPENNIQWSNKLKTQTWS